MNEPKNGFEVAREVVASFVEGSAYRAMAYKTIDNYEKAYNENKYRTSGHYDAVKKFMVGAKQECPDHPCIPDEKTRELRARIILEECLETIAALGVDILVFPVVADTGRLSMECVELQVSGPMSLQETVDGCCDIKVVTTGTLIACGVPDELVQDLVDDNNLDKIERGTIREDGKLIKPADHQPPNIAGFLKDLGYEV